MDCLFAFYPGGRISISSPIAYIATKNKRFFLLYTEDGVSKETAARVFSYQKPRWVVVVLERIGGSTAFTVDGKTITQECPPGDPIMMNAIVMRADKASDDLIAIDDVKVWEALPKDAAEEKDEKGKKKK